MALKARSASAGADVASVLAELLTEVYGPTAVERILAQLEPHLANPTVADERSLDWYKKCNLYVAYPDSFWRGDESDLFILADKIDYLEQLGINAVHILPFLESPMVDLGFDISDYKTVREELGGNDGLHYFLDRAKQANIRVFIDLVLNHVSEQHRWYRAAIEGNAFYRRFFIHSEERPKFIRSEERASGHWAVYEVSDGTTIAHRIIFPGLVDDEGVIPHWRQGEDGCWYYHTFYPQQLDLDWMNPDVFLAFVDILEHWLQYGLNFRLDAVTFIAKDIESGPVESHRRLHYILQALNLVVKQISPTSVFLVETCQPLSTVLQYYGERQLEAELAYNFDLMNDLWSSILNADADYVWTSLQSSHQSLPSWATWVNFLRNHDELTLEFATQEQRYNVLEHLTPYGEVFRKGFGVAGRTASFLQEDARRIKMAYLLLASLPGMPAIIYGDEIGKINEPAHVDRQLRYKREVLGLGDAKPDPRDLNRGRIAEQDLQRDEAQHLYQGMSAILTTRLALIDHFTRPPARMEAPASVFAAEYTADDESLRIYINLSAGEQELRVSQAVPHPELRVNDVSVSGDTLHLGPYAGVWLGVEN